MKTKYWLPVATALSKRANRKYGPDEKDYYQEWFKCRNLLREAYPFLIRSKGIMRFTEQDEVFLDNVLKEIEDII